MCAQEALGTDADLCEWEISGVCEKGTLARLLGSGCQTQPLIVDEP